MVRCGKRKGGAVSDAKWPLFRLLYRKFVLDGNWLSKERMRKFLNAQYKLEMLAVKTSATELIGLLLNAKDTHEQRKLGKRGATRHQSMEKRWCTRLSRIIEAELAELKYRCMSASGDVYVAVTRGAPAVEVGVELGEQYSRRCTYRKSNVAIELTVSRGWYFLYRTNEHVYTEGKRQYLKLSANSYLRPESGFSCVVKPVKEKKRGRKNFVTAAADGAAAAPVQR